MINYCIVRWVVVASDLIRSRNVLRVRMEGFNFVQLVLAVKGHHVDLTAGGMLNVVASLARICVDDLLGRCQTVFKNLKNIHDEQKDTKTKTVLKGVSG